MKPTTNNETIRLDPDTSRKSGIYLTEKGKAVYGNVEIYFYKNQLRVRETENMSDYMLASNPLELKALVDLGLIEIL
jgi:hypothetical protein